MRIDPRITRKIRKIFAPFRRGGIKKPFTVFANNCWGGRLYDKFAMQYLTPTIGLAMSPEDFLKFCANYEHYLSKELQIIETEQKKVNSEYGFYDCMLDDIRVCFRHFRDAHDAINKWNRRKERIVKDNIIVKLSYYTDSPDDKYDEKIIKKFAELPYKKLLFTNNKLIEENCHDFRVICLPIKNMDDHEFTQGDKVLKLKELKELINK